MINEDIHYRLPLKLINSYTWANLVKSAKAILPILGAYADKDGKAWPGVERIAGLAGYRDPRYRKIRDGMKDLIKNELVIREKSGRHYNYYLTDLAIWEQGSSYFPIYKEAMIISGKWARLTSSEKSLYPVLGNKAKVNDPDAMDTECHAIGNIYDINKYVEWAGISRPGFDSAYQGLNHENLIAFWPIVDFGRYGVYVPQ